MLTSKAKLFAKTTTKLGLATTVAVLWMAAVPFAGAAAAGYPISAARATAIHECSAFADEWGYAYRAAWPNMAKQANSAIDGLIANRSSGEQLHGGVSLQQPRASHHHLPHRSRGAGVMIVLLALVLYAAAGIAIAAAFLVFGVTRVLPEPARVTLGARIVLFPGAAALWPYVLIRWLRSSR